MQTSDWRLPESRVNWGKESSSNLFQCFLLSAWGKMKDGACKFPSSSALVGAQYGLFAVLHFCIRRTDGSEWFVQKLTVCGVDILLVLIKMVRATRALLEFFSDL